MNNPSPSPDSLGALRAVREPDSTVPSPPPVPGTRRTLWQHPATKTGGVVSAVLVAVGLLVPVWQTWLDQGHKIAVLEVRMQELQRSNKSLQRELDRLKAENAQLRKRLRQPK